VNGELVDSVNVVSNHEDGRAVWRWGTNDLVRGPKAGAVLRDGGPVTTNNFLPFSSIHPGRNVLRFRVECPGSASLARFTILGRTRLVETETQPAHLRLIATSASDPEAGKATRVDFRLNNVGDLPAIGVKVNVHSIDGKEIVVGRKELRYDELQGSERGSFFVIPRNAGPVRVEVGVESSNSNQPAVRLRGVSATAGASESDDDGDFPWNSLVFGAIAIMALLAFAWLRLRVLRKARASRASGQLS
jgi:hypothetical protein